LISVLHVYTHIVKQKVVLGVFLWTRQWTFGFHKSRGISGLPEWLSASQEGRCYWVS